MRVLRLGTGPAALALAGLLVAVHAGFLAGWLAATGSGDAAAVAEASRPAVVSILVETPPRHSSKRSAPVGEAAARPVGSGDGVGAGELVAGGSGFIIDASGVIVTNAHTIERARRIVVKLASGDRYPARLIGVDDRTDLAVLRIEAGTPLPSLRFGDPDALSPGDPVVAIGDPFGYEGTVTLGSVSASRRDYGPSDPVAYLQHDAAINPGSSGGPLLDRHGRVVGINTAIADEAPFYVGLALAIPADLAAAVVAELQAKGRVERGFAGMVFQSLDAELAAALDLAPESGLIVADVLPGSPAAHAGVQAAEVVRAIDGRPVRSLRDANRNLLLRRPGERVSMTLVRGEVSRQVTLTLAKPPIPAGADSAEAAADMTTSPPSPEDGDRLSLSDLQVVFADELAFRSIDGKAAAGSTPTAIAELDPDGLAARIGLRRGDVVLAVGPTAVGSSRELAAAISAEGPGPVALRIRRPGEDSAYIVVHPERAAGGAGGASGNNGSVRAGPF